VTARVSTSVDVENIVATVTSASFDDPLWVRCFLMWSVALPFPHGGQSVAEQILAISGWFEAARPTAPHFHLSLLATHNSYRGGGAGMGLLKESLARIDTLVRLSTGVVQPAVPERGLRAAYRDHDGFGSGRDDHVAVGPLEGHRAVLKERPIAFRVHVAGAWPGAAHDGSGRPARGMRVLRAAHVAVARVSRACKTLQVGAAWP